MGLITATVFPVRSNVLVNYESEFQQRAARITKVTGVVSDHLYPGNSPQF